MRRTHTIHRWVVAGILGMGLGSQADTVTLRNGAVLEGLILDDTPAQVTFREGRMTLSLPRERIASLAYSPPAEREALQAAFDAPKTKPPALGDLPPPLPSLAATLGQLDAQAAQVQHDRARQDALRAEETHWTRLQRERLEALELAVRRMEELRPDEERNQFNAHPPGYRKQFKVYQEQVAVANAARVQLLEAENKVRALQDDKQKLDQGLSDYLHRIGEAEHLLQQADQDPALAPHRETVVQLRARLQAHGGRVQQIDLPHERRNGSILVRARLNNRADAVLLLDTGASMVVLSRDLAARAGIVRQEGPLMTLSLADGSTRSLPAALVDRLQVGSTQGQQIPAVISESPPGEGIDGLLGMSFLEQFDWSYDPRTDRLVLRQLRTP